MDMKDVLYGNDKEAAELVEILGVNPALCRRLILDITHDEPSTAWVEVYVPSAALAGVKRVLELRKPQVFVVELPDGSE